MLQEKEYLIYSTNEKVIGMIKLPMDGNPNKSMGLIAHPKKIKDICAKNDELLLFTVGGDDLCLNMWRLDPNIID